MTTTYSQAHVEQQQLVGAVYWLSCDEIGLNVARCATMCQACVGIICFTMHRTTHLRVPDVPARSPPCTRPNPPTRQLEEIMMRRRRKSTAPAGVVFLNSRVDRTTKPGAQQMADTGLTKIFQAQYDVVNDNSTFCMRERFLCKYTPQCTRSRPKCIGKVFITGCSGSGTHSVASTLAAVSDKENVVTHEGPRNGLAALVSWPTRCTQVRASLRTAVFRESRVR